MSLDIKSITNDELFKIISGGTINNHKIGGIKISPTSTAIHPLHMAKQLVDEYKKVIKQSQVSRVRRINEGLPLPEISRELFDNVVDVEYIKSTYPGLLQTQVPRQYRKEPRRTEYINRLIKDKIEELFNSAEQDIDILQSIIMSTRDLFADYNNLIETFLINEENLFPLYAEGLHIFMDYFAHIINQLVDPINKRRGDDIDIDISDINIDLSINNLISYGYFKQTGVAEVQQVAILIIQIRQLIINFLNFNIIHLPTNAPLWQLGVGDGQYHSTIEYYRDVFDKTFNQIIEKFPLQSNNNNIVSNIKTLF